MRRLPLHCCCLAMGAIAFCSSSYAQTNVNAAPAPAEAVECEGTPWPFHYTPAPEPAPPSAVLGLRTPVRFPNTALAPIDRAALLAEDEQSTTRGAPLRAGVPRPIERSLLGDWRALDDGARLWSASISVGGAVALRLHVSVTSAFPRGAQLFVHDNLESGTVSGPFTGAEGDFWTGSVGGDTVYVEYLAPAGASVELPFVLDTAAAIYRSPEVTADNGLRAPLDCMGDVACYSDWEDVSYSVAKILFSSSDDPQCPNCQYYCTGTLLASQNADETPYFLTSAHCIDAQDEAGSAEFTWFNQRSTCGGDFMTTAVSYNSELLATSGELNGADWTLLMVQGVLPPGVFWSGWTSSDPSSGTWSVGVHHPDASWKRYSRGQRYYGGSYYHQIRFNTAGSVGQIYFGSSGSGIFRESDQKLFGNASFTSGEAGCDNINVYAYYGRFSSYYSTIASLLTGGSDDALENNDTCGAAPTLSDGTYQNLIVKHIDEDWYRFSVDYGEHLDIDLAFTDAFGNIDAELYDACGGNLLATANGVYDGETISYVHQDFASDVWLRVFLSDDTRNFYDLTVSRSLDDCNNDGLADSCNLDCGSPGTPCFGEPDCGTSFDCNTNGVPDECETDCNGDGLADECALLTQPQDNLNTCTGGVAQFSVSASDPGFGFQWYGPAGMLINDARMSGAQTGTLTITDVAPADAGAYYCEILDGCVLAVSDSASLTVADIGTIDVQPDPVVELCAGGLAIVSIDVSGTSPAPTYQWYEDGLPIANGGRYSGAKSDTLTIANITAEDQGRMYTCTVSNGCSTMQSDPGMLQINTPAFTVQPEGACALVGDTVTLHAEASTPAANLYYQWRKEGVSGSIGTSDTLVLGPLDASSAGQYYAIAFTLSPTCLAESERATVTVPTSAVCWQPTPGDMDGDGDYDLADMNGFMQCYATDVSSDFCCACANVDDGNSTVDTADWTALQALLTGPQ